MHGYNLAMSTWIGILSVLLAVVSYSIYFRAIFRKNITPHAITWLIWGTLNTFIFIQQAVNGAGPGAWVTGVAAAANIVIFLLSLRYGERSLAVLDWICLIVAAVVIVLWLLHSDATITVSLACVIFIIGLLPTLRKSYYKPHEEAVATFGLNSLKFFLALFALQSVTVVTGLYPLTLGIANGFIVIFLIVRRRQMNRI